MRLHPLLIPLLTTLACAQGTRPALAQRSGLARLPWILADSYSFKVLPPRQAPRLVPEATVVVVGDYLPLFTEREIRFLEFRAALLADLRVHLEENVPSAPQGTFVPVRYGGNPVQKLYPFGGRKW